MRDLSVELGMSDVGLRKLCHRNGISPPRGMMVNYNSNPAPYSLNQPLACW